MSEAAHERLARIEQALHAARRLADPSDALGREARELLPGSTGLSKENVELGLSECLETAPESEEIAELCRNVPLAPAAHVLLSANVFVAAHRAVALALAASDRVYVRSSRREPEMARLLRAAGAPFELVEALRPEPGDHVWAYGTEATLAELRARNPPEVTLHEHGPGMGIALVQEPPARDLASLADALAHDVVLFDQRGCSSPRIAFVRGSPESTEQFARALAQALERWGQRVPRGRFSAAEMADESRYRDSAAYAMQLLSAGDAAVSLDESGAHAVLVPPIGRNIHVVRIENPSRSLLPLVALVTSVGWCGDAGLEDEIGATLPHARRCALGFMQRPRFDGPVDRRGLHGPA
jgi:hypothetical protein